MAEKCGTAGLNSNRRTRDMGKWPSHFLSFFCGIMGLLFIFAGIAKLHQPYDFLSSILSFRLFTFEQGLVIAKLTPLLEVVVGLSLLIQQHIKAALFAGTALSLGFVFVRFWVVQSGRGVECNCFGAFSITETTNMIDWSSVIVSIIQFLGFLLAFVYVFFFFANEQVVRDGK